MFDSIIIAVAVLLAALLIYAATRPDSFRVERSISINAPAEKIFSFINDFREWEPWSPWEKVDSTVKRSYRETDNGEGAIYEWNGNKNLGQGRMEIIESSPFSKVIIKIDFIKPFEAHNMVEFTLIPEGDSTRVTQAMYGPSPFISKLMSIFCSMDKMVGKKYEEGLANLKAISE